MAAASDRPSFFGPLLLANDFDVTVAFYRDALGLPVEGRAPYAECRSESARFAVLDARFWSRSNEAEMPAIRGAAGPPSFLLAVQVPDVDAAFERLMADGMKFLAPPTDRPAMALRNALLRDPDGRTVQLMTPKSPSRGPA